MSNTIKLIGHLDTAHAAQTDKDIEQQIAAFPEKPSSLIFDCSELDYISSTGLRIVLKYKKLYPNIEVVNVSNEVYNVFEMTGFSRIITVKKALRTVNLDACTLLAKGGNGEVYRINDEEIIKLSLFADGEEKLIEEMNTAREAFVLGVPTVISFDTVQVNDGRRGIVMEAVNPDTLSSWLSEHPEELDSYAQPYADMFLTTNAIITEPGKFRSLKQWLQDMLEAPLPDARPEWDEALREIVGSIPEGQHLIHNDGHPRNVLMTGDKENRQLMLIDMGDMGCGHPVMEIIGWAFMLLAPTYSIAYPMAEHFTGLSLTIRHAFMRKVFSCYFHTTDEAVLNRIMGAAANVGTIKLACIHHSVQAPFVKKEDEIVFYNYIATHKEEIKQDLQYLCSLIPAT